jgi:hypothetical protein
MQRVITRHPFYLALVSRTELLGETNELLESVPFNVASKRLDTCKFKFKNYLAKFQVIEGLLSRLKVPL